MANNKNNRICVCCSTEYRYCNTCSEDGAKPAWYSIYCSENCKKLFQATSGYFAKTVTVEETRARFDDCDLSYKDKLKPKFIEAINDVYGKETKTEIVDGIDIAEESVDEVVIPSSVEETTENDVEVVKAPKRYNRNKKKVVFE